MISSSSCARDQGSITRVAGIEVGHYTESRRPTGCSVVLARDGAVAGVDVRGAAPGTRETDLLDPSNLVEQVHAVMLSGGSAWGLEAATGAVRWLEEQGVGLDSGVGRLPLVPYHRPGDKALGDVIRMLAPKHSAVLLANHGPVVSGPDLEGAIYASEELEETAKIFLLLQNAQTNCLNAEQIEELKVAFKLDI